jgi:blue light- and temperature-responsive anti-repressor
MLKRLKYLSRQAHPMTRAEIDEIVLASCARNAMVDVTGALVVTGNVFFQILEGPSDAVDVLFAKICADDRHTDVLCLDEQSQREGRLFPDWGMTRIALGSSPGAVAIEMALRQLIECGASARVDLTGELSRMMANEARAA